MNSNELQSLQGQDQQNSQAKFQTQLGPIANFWVPTICL